MPCVLANLTAMSLFGLERKLQISRKVLNVGTSPEALWQSCRNRISVRQHTHPEQNALAQYYVDLAATRYSFDGLAHLLAVASPLCSGDELAGIAAQSAEHRMAARFVLADLPLKAFLAEAVVPYETDEVTRLIVDGHDRTVFAAISTLTVGEFREWLLSNEVKGSDITGVAAAITPEMAAAVSKLMR